MHPVNVGTLTVEEQQVLVSLPWAELIPLALEAFRAWRNQDFQRFIEVLMEIFQLVLNNNAIGPQRFGSFIELLIKLMPLILEIISNLENQQAQPGRGPTLP